MDRISVQVTIHNNSDATLQLAYSNLDFGDWTNGNGPTTTIVPGGYGSFEGEGHLIVIVPADGTEGVVRYTINAPGDVGELYIHWDSALIESQYGNTFDIRCPAGWDVSYSGGQGHNAALDVYLQRSAVHRVPNFDPHGRGFAFKNSWSSSLPSVRLGFVLKTLYSNNACIGNVASAVAQSLIDAATAGIAPIAVSAMNDDWGPTLTTAGSGLCGGMVYTVMDYYANHLLPPTLSQSPGSDTDPLFTYIRQRQLDSFDFQGDGCRFLIYSLSQYPNGDSGFVQDVGLWKGRSWVAYREAYPQIRADIDAGKLSPIGLIHTDSGDLSNNHQVLAYGYQRSGQDVTLYIYDPNHGQNKTTYQFNITDTSGEVHLTENVEGGNDDIKRIYCFFRINNYSPQTPPEGRRFNSLKDAIAATSEQPPGGTLSVRASVTGTDNPKSMLKWLHSL